MRSVSVVPAGITKYRDGLYPLALFTKEESEQVIDLIESYQSIFSSMLKTRKAVKQYESSKAENESKKEIAIEELKEKQMIL